MTALKYMTLYKTNLKIMKTITSILVLSSLFLCTFQASQVQLKDPVATPFVDDTQSITLAEKQTFTLPITTRTITHRLQMFPKTTDQCWFSSQFMLYKPLNSISFIVENEAKITGMLALTKRQKLFLIDQQNNIFSYSLDEHYLLKQLSPKTNFAGLRNKITTQALVATEDQQIVYFITPEKYYIFNVESLGLQILEEQKFPVEIKDIQKSIVYKDNLIILSSQSGLFIFKIKQQDNTLLLAQKITFPNDVFYTDMQLQQTTKMLYLLALNQPLIKVLHYQPNKFPNQDKSLTIFQQYDNIDYSSVTNKHSSQTNQRNSHLRLQISRQRQQQTLMILFLHRYHNIVAELSYNINFKNWYFVRYFKFTMRVNQIHISSDMMAVVGDQSMGIFPYGIHPRLIDQEFNGQMTMTSMIKLKMLQNGKFVGLTKETIEYGIIKLEEKAQLNCKIEQQSKLKTVKLKANLTACSNQDKLSYESYCAYQKTFALEQMQMTVHAPVANILWTGMIFFIMLTILGIVILFAMQRNKEEELKRLEQYFEQRKRKEREEVPTSERKTFNYL